MRRWLAVLGFIIGAVQSNAQGYNIVGDSFEAGDDCYILTPLGLFQNGAIWYNQAIDLNDPFTLQYTANFGDNDAGADGMVFVMQQVSNSILGEPGGGIGFSGFSPSFGVEFDTWQNFDNFDPAFDHMAILRDGNVNHGNPNNLAGPVTISSTSTNVEDGQDYIIQIDWDPSANSFTVSVNCTPRISLVIDLLGQVFTDSPNVFWGFTGATGGEFNIQSVCLDSYILGLPETFETCFGDPVQLEAPAATVGTFSWEPAEFLDDPNSNAPIATVDVDTEFTLTYEDLCGELQTQTTTVIVNNPTLDLGGDISVCGNVDVELNPGATYDEIVWSDGSDNPTLEVTQSGTYWADAFIGDCFDTDTVIVEFVEAPDYTGPLNIQLCEGEFYVFELNQPGTTIEWFDGDDSTERFFNISGTYSFDLSIGDCTTSYELELDFAQNPSIDLGPDINVCGDEDVLLEITGVFDSVEWSDGSSQNQLTVTQSGTYWVDIQIGACSGTDTVEVAILEAPEYNDPLQIDLCEGESYLFELNQATTDILWFDGDDSDTRTFTQEGSYDFELTLGDCSDEFTLEVEVFPFPTFELGADISICEGLSTTLETGLTDAQVTWSTGATGTTISVSQEDTYWATAIENGCEFSDTVSLSLIPPPEVSVSGVEALCPGEEGDLTADTSEEISWSTGETTNTITVNEGGFYTVEVTASTGCSSQESFFVQILNFPRIILEESLVKCADEPFRIVADSDDDVNLIWDDGTKGPVLIVDFPGSYFVELTNDCGTTQSEVVVTEEFCFEQVYLPNAFTPDGDGLNDIFKPVTENVEEFELRIFNRGGQEVFQTNDPTEGWNGNFNNDSFYCQSGVYTWKLRVRFEGNLDPEEWYGLVTLIR